jgi:hypothetical protein
MPRAAEIVQGLGTAGLVAIVTATFMMAALSLLMVRLPGWLELPRRALEALG